MIVAVRTFGDGVQVGFVLCAVLSLVVGWLAGKASDSARSQRKRQVVQYSELVVAHQVLQHRLVAAETDRERWHAAFLAATGQPIDPGESGSASSVT